MAEQDDYQFWQDYAPVYNTSLPTDWSFLPPEGSQFLPEPEMFDPSAYNFPTFDTSSFDNPWNYMPQEPVTDDWSWLQGLGQPEIGGGIAPEAFEIPTLQPQAWEQPVAGTEAYGWEPSPMLGPVGGGLGRPIVQPGGQPVPEGDIRQNVSGWWEKVFPPQKPGTAPPGLFGTGLGVADVLKMGGAAFQHFSGPPEARMSAEQRDLMRAQAEELRARHQARGGGGGGGGGGGPLRPGGMVGVNAILERMGLGGAGELYNKRLGEFEGRAAGVQGAQPQQIDAETQRVSQMLEAQEERDFAMQEQQAIERSIRDGTNPAAAQAEIARMRLVRAQQRPIEARQQVLQMTEATQQAQLRQLEPYLKMLEMINPQQYLNVLGQLYATPLPG